MCRRLRRREKLLRKPLEDAGGAGADLIFVKSFTPFTLTLVYFSENVNFESHAQKREWRILIVQCKSTFNSRIHSVELNV